MANPFNFKDLNITNNDIIFKILNYSKYDNIYKKSTLNTLSTINKKLIINCPYINLYKIIDSTYSNNILYKSYIYYLIGVNINIYTDSVLNLINDNIVLFGNFIGQPVPNEFRQQIIQKLKKPELIDVILTKEEIINMIISINQ